MAAGSVGASAAPRIHAVVHPKPSATCAISATSAAVPIVPTSPSAVIGIAAKRNRGQPTCMPPSKRITIRATTAIRSTVWIAT